jgi:hypothetical protein
VIKLITSEGTQTSTTKETIDYKTGNRTITTVFDEREWCVYIDVHFLDLFFSDLMIFSKPFPCPSFVMKISATEDKIFGYRVFVQLKDNNSGCIYRENGNRYLTKKEMLDNFRLVINETIDMSKGQVYFEDAINKFSEMGFNLR